MRNTGSSKLRRWHLPRATPRLLQRNLWLERQAWFSSLSEVEGELSVSLESINVSYTLRVAGTIGANEDQVICTSTLSVSVSSNMFTTNLPARSMTTFTGTLSAGGTFVIWDCKCVFKSHDTLKTLRELLNHGNAELLFVSRLQLNSDVRDLSVPNLKISEFDGGHSKFE